MANEFKIKNGLYVSGSTQITEGATITGSVNIKGTLASNVFMNPQTIGDNVVIPAGYNALVLGPVDMSSSIQVGSGSNLTILESFTNLATTGSNSFVGNQVITGSLEITEGITGSLQGTASYAANANTANNATSASYALTASYISGSGGGVGFPFSGSAVITGSLLITELSGSGVRYIVADANGLMTAQSASAAIKTTQAFTATSGQTTFSVTNGYSTGYVDVFVNGSKLNATEFTDTSGTNIVLATGSFVDDVVEVVKYLPASGVSNNVLRQQTIFTASAGQTVFSASYTPGLIDIFYNGSKLNSGDFTANNGTYFTLATASAANDILDVFVYSYQVGAFSGIGGTGTATQVAYFDSTNSITGSPNFTISGSTMTVTGSLIVSGSGTFTNIGPAVFSGSITSTQGFTGSFSGTATNATSASYAASATSASYAIVATTASYADALTVAGTLTAQTLVVQTITSSVDFVTGSTRFGSILGNTHVFSGSITMNPGGLFVSSSGNVGIGTTNPTSKLHIINNTDGFVGRFTGGDASTVTAGIYANSTTGFASIGVQSNHQFRLFTNDADRLTIGTDGSVGIGTTNPQALLHLILTGNSTRVRMEAGSSYAALLDFYNGSTARWSIGIDNTQAYGKLENRVLATDAIRFYDSSNNVVLTPSSGNVGIGTVPSNTKFHVNATGVNQTVSAVEISIAGSGTFQRGVRMLNGGMTTGESLLYMVGRNSAAKNTGQMYFYYDGDGSNNNRLSLGLYAVDDVFNITAAGLVGIGTTNPAGQLSGTIGLSIVNATNAALGLSNGTNHWLNYLSGTTYRIWNNSVSEVMTILLNGNIGIGTSTPGFKLDITSGVPDVLRITNTGSATGNNPAAQFFHTHGNHSWGILAEFRIGASGGSDRGSILFSHAYDTNTWGLGFGYNDSSYFRINKDQGPYGGGWGTTLFSMDRSGNYSFSGSNVSDRRNKKNITYITDSQLEILLKLKPASFNKKSPGKEEYSDHVHTGFIAQDVLEENIPNLVHGNEEEGYGLDYDGILALAVKAIQELKAEIEILKNK